jgi:hypothetical protein
VRNTSRRYGEAPVRQHRGNAISEATGKPAFTHQNTAPTKRRCPSCRITLPSGAFIPTKHDRTRLGIAARQCPRCNHRGLLVSFKREAA